MLKDELNSKIDELKDIRQKRATYDAAEDLKK
jgi:hypothetical protein